MVEPLHGAIEGAGGETTGSMTASGTRLVAYIAVPRERIDALFGAADRLLSLELNATPLRYRRARVMSIHLSTEPELIGNLLQACLDAFQAESPANPNPQTI